MVLFALLVVETPNASATERLAFAHALQAANYAYGNAAHSFRIEFFAGLDEAREHFAKQDFPDDPDFSLDDYVQRNANLAVDRDAAAERIRADVESAAQIANVRRWNIELQISEQPWIDYSSH